MILTHHKYAAVCAIYDFFNHGNQHQLQFKLTETI
jgi:hypothetical protein